MIIRGHLCGADRAGVVDRRRQLSFHDPYRADGSARSNSVYAYRDHLSARREEEAIQRRKRDHWGKGGLDEGRRRRRPPNPSTRRLISLMELFSARPSLAPTPY